RFPQMWKPLRGSGGGSISEGMRPGAIGRMTPTFRPRRIDGTDRVSARNSLTSAPPAPRIPALYEAHLPAQQSAPQAHARFSRSHADAVRPGRSLGPPPQGAQKTHGVNSSPAVSEGFSRDDRLRKRREFEECYASGVRVSGRHVQVFLLPVSG